MRVLATKSEFRRARAGLASLGLVPTMGFLHEGHLSLVRRAKAECDAVAVSIFVNPLQFAAGGDLARYPRSLERDAALLEAEGADLLFAPGPEEMYPAGFDLKIDVGGVSEGLEGAARPGHFIGVATVVAKLFNIAAPTRAYFGQKDAQQAAVIRKLVEDLDVDVEVIVAPTVREPGGLALSSRNSYLSKADHQAAGVLYQALLAAERLHAGGERRGEALREAMLEVLRREPRADPDYVSVAHPATLKALDAVGPEGALVSLAVRLGSTRLIDNLLIGLNAGAGD